jgi:hypothetical protein
MQKRILTKAFLTALLLASPMAWAESQYPAADFEPVILFQDADLIAKHGEAAKERERALAEQARAEASRLAEPSQPATPSASAGQAGPAAGIKSGNFLTENYPILLIALALAGFVFWSSRRPAAKAPEIRYEPPGITGRATAETGVARYLKSLPAKAPAAETGVSRYLKSLPASAKAAAAETGVARYIKNLK